MIASINTDAVLGTFMLVSFVVWIAVEFLGIALWARRTLRRLGIMESPQRDPESVDDTVQDMDAWPYAATRNAKQHRGKGK